MAKYDGLSAKELRTRLLDADKHNNSLHKTCGDLEKTVLGLQNQLSELYATARKTIEGAKNQIDYETERVHALSHDLEYERARRISAENARFDLEQRLHGLSNTHVEVSAIREIMPGLRIDRNGDIA